MLNHSCIPGFFFWFFEMATPTVTTKNFQTIWDCDSVTGAVGNKPVLESEIKKQGSNSVGFTMSTVGSNMRNREVG